MTAPLFTDADLYRMVYVTGAIGPVDLDVSVVEPGACRCHEEDVAAAWAPFSSLPPRLRPREIELPDLRECRESYSFAGGAIRLSCSNGDAVCNAFERRGIAGKAMDRRLLAIFKRGAQREAQQQRAADSELDRIAASCDDIAEDSRRIAAELQASRLLVEAGHSAERVAKAGRALHGGGR